MRFIREGDKEVAWFVTASGVTGIVATSIPVQALEALRSKLACKVRRDDAKLARKRPGPAAP